MDELKKAQKLQELKKKYGYDIAIFKQTSQENQGISQDELLNSLLIYDLQNSIVELINGYADTVDHNSKEMMILVSALFNLTGEIIANVARHDPINVLLFKETAMSQFDTHLKGFLNVKQSGQPTE